MIIISYATKNTPYMQVIEQRLKPTLKKFKLKYDIEYPEDFGSWQENTHYKAEFIKKMLLRHKEAVCFIDSDATIEKYPKLLYKLQDYDMSLHYLDFDLQWRKKSGTKREALSGTLYLNYNEKMLKFLDDWIAENEIDAQWEQRNMQKVLERWKDKLRIYPLPYEYIVIVYGGDRIPSHMVKKEDVVILHHQASRRYRNWKRRKK